jgi:hypothetical protein
LIGKCALAAASLAVGGCGRLRFDATPTDVQDLAYVHAVLADGPVGYWRLGEDIGTIAHDSSGNGLDGIYQGNVTYGRPGAIVGDPDTAIVLDGSTAFVRIPSSPRIDGITNSDVTVEAWVADGLTEVAELFSAWDGGNGYQVTWDNGEAGAYAPNGGARSPRPITDSNWHQVVVVWSAGTSTVYVDAQMVASGTAPFMPSAFENQIGNQCSGALSTQCTLFHAGSVDEVSVYDAVLDATRVQAHYDAAYGL